MTSKIFTRTGSCLAAAGLLAVIAFAAPSANADPTYAPPQPTVSACSADNSGVLAGNQIYVPNTGMECDVADPDDGLA